MWKDYEPRYVSVTNDGVYEVGQTTWTPYGHRAKDLMKGFALGAFVAMGMMATCVAASVILGRRMR